MRWISDQTVERLRRLGNLPELDESRYRLLKEVGRGGMGTVYLAEDTLLGRQVAFKILDVSDASGELAERLLREARVLARLEHPGIVPVHDVGELADGRFFYTMKYVRGDRLDRHLGGFLSLFDRLSIFGRLCEAVAFAHAHGVLHRDLKPENVMVGPFGEVLVMDWGVAKLLRTATKAEGPVNVARVSDEKPRQVHPLQPMTDPLTTAHGVVMGTPGYMAPEQARGEVDRLDPRTDVYSLGAVLQFLLTGQVPSEAPTAIWEEGRAGAAIPRASKGGPPRRLVAVVDKAMSEDPDQRYPTAAELAEEIQRYLADQPVDAYPEGPVVRLGRFVSRHRVAVILLAAYIVVRVLVRIFLGS